MIFEKTNLEWVYEVKFNVFTDERGSFIKTFHSKEFEEIWLNEDFKESFYSISNKWVIRWMHFQLPPHDHHKFVYPILWEVVDVIVDIRKNSPTFWKYVELFLSEKNHNGVFIPKWFAHWFMATTDSATLVYMDTTIHNKESDSWICYNSFWYNRWIDNPILSEKDKNLTKLCDFNSPFIY